MKGVFHPKAIILSVPQEEQGTRCTADDASDGTSAEAPFWLHSSIRPNDDHINLLFPCKLSDHLVKAAAQESHLVLNPRLLSLRTCTLSRQFVFLSNTILQSVNRCRSITHRFLGFARRMEVQIEVLDIDEILKETSDPLEKEAPYRNIVVTLDRLKIFLELLRTVGRFNKSSST